MEWGVGGREVSGKEEVVGWRGSEATDGVAERGRQAEPNYLLATRHYSPFWLFRHSAMVTLGRRSTCRRLYDPSCGRCRPLSEATKHCDRSPDSAQQTHPTEADMATDSLLLALRS